MQPAGGGAEAASEGAPAAAAQDAQAAPAPPTPLERRQAQRQMQRSVRLAVTAYKAAGSRCGEASARGTSSATQLSNSLLTERFLPGLRLPAALSEWGPELQTAAAEKLRRRQREQLAELRGALEDTERAVEDMRAAARDVGSHLGPRPTDGVGAVAGAASSGDGSCAGAAWLARLPVFHLLTLPEAEELLRRVLDMHSRELEAKASIVRRFERAVEDAASAGGAESGGEAGGGGEAGDALRRRLLAAVASWAARPFYDEGEAEQLLAVLTDEMVGF